MLYYIKRTFMLKEAQDSLPLDRKPQSLFIECMIFLLVAFICMLPQGFVSFVASFIIIMTDPAYIDMIASGNIDETALTEYTNNLLQNLPPWYMAVLLSASGFMILGAIIYCKAIQKRSLRSVGFVKRGFIVEYLVGAAIGLLMISLPVLASVLTGCVKITVSKSISPLILFIYLLAFILQGMGEEALFRGYFMTSIARKHKIWIAIIVSSLMFSIFHTNNASFGIIPFINITLFGIFAAVYMLKRGSIWGVGAIHSLWNFGQGNIFGLNVSGNGQMPSLFISEQADFGKILSGGDFGPEGGLGATVVLLTAILFALLMPTKKSEIAE